MEVLSTNMMSLSAGGGFSARSTTRRAEAKEGLNGMDFLAGVN